VLAWHTPTETRGGEIRHTLLVCVAMPAIDLAQVSGQARTVLALTGADVERFLQGTLSADLRGLDTRHARAATLLTVKGKVIAEVIVVRRAGPDPVFYLLVPTACAGEVIVDLDRHVIMDDVTITPCELAVGFAWGEEGRDLPNLDVDSTGEGSWWTRHPGVGRLHVGSAESLAAWVQAHGQGMAEDFHAARIHAHVPAWQHEITPDHFPPEVGFVEAVSYSKGCYRGQEPLARIHARGQVNWVMVAVRSAEAGASTTLPAAGHAIALQHPSRANAGRWTSAVVGREGGLDGLAIVHRSLAVVGTTLEIEGGSGALEVTTGPLGDDTTQAARVG
jgi:folate-binding protein YgfZ